MITYSGDATGSIFVLAIINLSLSTSYILSFSSVSGQL